jgi:hypothetical protein
MPEAAIKSSPAEGPAPSRAVIAGLAANEFVFAVVGHVGSGTTKNCNHAARSTRRFGARRGI